MADRLILLPHPDDSRSWAIIEAFAERTGLTLERRNGGAEFPLHERDHEVQVVQTLTDIDAQWSRHVTLGDPTQNG
jgi:hypothetical protein